jgi:hypothetical protein
MPECQNAGLSKTMQFFSLLAYFAPELLAYFTPENGLLYPGITGLLYTGILSPTH